MVILSALMLGAFGCGGGQLHPSQVQEVRVIAITSTKPAAGPGEGFRLDVTVANPDGLDLEILVWSCTPSENGCMEALLPDINSWTAIIQPGEPIAREVPYELASFTDVDLDSMPFQIWALACKREACDIIDDVASAQSLPTLTHTTLKETLADPMSWMVDLPMDEASLGTKSFEISRNTADTDRNTNPLLEARFIGSDEAELQVGVNTDTELAFWVDDPENQRSYIFGFTTVGRFEEFRLKTTDHSARHYLLAPDKPATGHVYIVAVDGDGGTTVWDKPVVVN